MPTRAQLKDSAKRSMRNSNPSVILIALVYIVITYILEMLSYKVMFPGMSLAAIFQLISSGDIAAVAATANPAASQLLQIAISIMSMMLGVGMTSVCLNVSRAVPADFASLFDPFGMFLKFLWLDILMSIYVFLWSLLFIIPGIIASYRYSMAVYILLDNPEYSASECIRLSKEMMAGKKFDLFILKLSFIGWQILTIIPFVSLYVLPYTETTVANFYNALSNYIPEAGYTVHDGNDSTGGSGWNSGKDPWD